MRILVVYASKHGATREIAEHIARALNDKRLDTDLRPVDGSADPADYDAVVLGSAVYFGSWMKEATEFAHRYRSVLVGRPVWLFSSGPIGDTPVAEPKQIVELRARLAPRDHHDFRGALDRHRLTLPERAIVRAMKAPAGDFREWNAIERWAASIAEALKPSVVTPVDTTTR
jgi:menaquinone-dependent protoporphyrinogen oxidase